MPYPVDLQSAHWKAFSRERKAANHGRCAVCGWDYRKRKGWLELHHLTYIRANRERGSDVIPLCDRHHKKGRYTREQIKTDRQVYLTLKWTGIVVLLPFRAIRLCLRRK